MAIAALAAVAAALWLSVVRESRPDVGEPVDAFMHVHGLAIPGWAQDTVYLSTHEGLLALGPKNGWVGVSRESHDFMGFSAHPTEDGVLYSSGHPARASRLRNPIGFMVSTDGGATWRTRALQGEADFHAMAVQPGDGEVIYGWNVSPPGLHRSLDGGRTWQRIASSFLEQAGGAFSLAIHPADSARIYAGSQQGLLASRGGGANWEALLEGPVTAVATDARDPDRLVAYAALQGLVLSEDGGATFRPLGFEIGDDAAVSHIAINPRDPSNLYLGTIGQSLYRSTDGGESWEQLAEGGRLTDK